MFKYTIKDNKKVHTMSSMRKRFKYTIFWKKGLFWLAKTTFAIAFEIKFLMKA